MKAKKIVEEKVVVKRVRKDINELMAEAADKKQLSEEDRYKDILVTERTVWFDLDAEEGDV